jgi:hypothetical protein
MAPTHFSQQAAPAHDSADFDEQGDIQSFDDGELELALKSVSWNARDLAQFMRSARAQ